MLQRVFFDWHQQQDDHWDVDSLSKLSDDSFATEMIRSNQNARCPDLIEGLFGARRQLYKRAVDYNAHQDPEIYQAIAHQPYDRLTQLGEQLGNQLADKLKLQIGPGDLLIDAPPINLEVQFKVEVNDGDTADSLENISPVVNALARQQFDDFVKRVRIFVHPRFSELLPADALDESLRAAIL